MKLFLISFLTSIIIINCVQAQNTFKDAIKLNDYVVGQKFDVLQANGISDDQYLNILIKYLDEEARDTVKTSGDFYDYFNSNGNKFLLPLMPRGVSSGSDTPKLVPVSVFKDQIGGLNVSTIADGAAQFLIERANQELTIAYFSKLKDKVKPGTDLGILLPTTSEYLRQFEPLEFASMLSTIREAFIEDLNNLPENIPNLEKNHATEFAKDEVKILLASLELVKPLKAGNDLATILNLAASSKHLNSTQSPELQTLRESLKLLDLISQSLLAEETTKNKVWVSYTEIEGLLKDDITAQIYFGLLYQQLLEKDLELSGKKVANLFSNKVTQLNDLKTIVRDFNSKIQTLSVSLKTIQKITESGDKLTIEQFYTYSNEIIEILDVIESFKKIDPNLPTQSLNELLYFADKANSIINNLSAKNYASLVMDVTIVLDSLNIPLNDQFLKYGTFIANVAEAESSEQVKAAIETAVLPVGSSQIKRNAKFSISINSYVGLSMFNQSYVIDSIASDSASKLASLEYDNFLTFDSFGLHAPIGIEFAWGIDKNFWPLKRVQSFSLFFPLIDLGSIVSFRVDDKNEKLDVPTITLDNVFVLGCYAVFGFKNIPLSMGVGFQKGPQLREVAIENKSSLPVLAERDWGLGIFISADIPLFNLKVNPR
tara:strand:+ start:48167 stop:50134 length:1968 start_codon:yes stop_codon:yes gene_type:complete